MSEHICIRKCFHNGRLFKPGDKFTPKPEEKVPPHFAPSEKYVERMDPTLEESARISGAGLFTITRKITIPLVLPSILSGSLLIMLYSMAHFGTVAVLGIENGIYNIPTLIYERIHQSGGSFDAIRTGTVLATVLVTAADERRPPPGVQTVDQG